jgi:hypothetical protein
LVVAAFCSFRQRKSNAEQPMPACRTIPVASPVPIAAVPALSTPPIAEVITNGVIPEAAAVPVVSQVEVNAAFDYVCMSFK